MLRRSARLKQKKQDEQLKWERWFAVQRWAKKREKSPPHAYLDLPCPDSEFLFATNSPKQPNNAHHVLEKSVMERSAKCSDELHENMLSPSKKNSAHMGTAFQMSDHGKLLSPMDKLKQKSPLSGAGSTTVSTLQHDKNLLGNFDLTHKKQPSPKKLLENSCNAGKRTPYPAGLLHSPMGQSPRSNPAGNRTPIVLIQKLPKFCQLGSPVSVSSLSRMNSPAESFGHADLPVISSSFEKSCEGNGFVPWDDGSVRNFLCSEMCSSTCIDYHGCHASETSDYGIKDKTDTTQTYSSTGSLVLTSLELAANERIDDQCFNSMLETCAQMTKVCQNDDIASVEKSPQGVQDRHISHLQSVDKTWSSAQFMDLSGQNATEANVNILMSQDQTCSVTEPASLGSCQGSVDSSVRKDPAVSEACSASYKNKDTGKKVRGRKKRCLQKDAPSVKSTMCGSGRQPLEYGVTVMGAREGRVKMLMKEKAMLKEQEKKGIVHKCRHCSFCTKDVAVRQEHVRNCHPISCRSSHHRFSDSTFRSHKAVCDMGSYSRCSLCVRSFRKKHRKRHFHSQSHQRIVHLLRKAALHIQRHGNIYELLSSITCDVSSGCEKCHSTSLNMEEPEDDGFAENRTAEFADTSLHSDLQQSSTSLPECQQSQGAVFLADASLDNSQRYQVSSQHQASLQGQERTCDLEAEPITDCSDSVVCEGTLVFSASETGGSQVIAADCFHGDVSSSCQQHSVSAVDSQHTSTGNLDNNPSLVRVSKNNVEVLNITNPTPAWCSSTAVSRPVLRSVGPSTQKEGDNTFIDLIDFLDEYDLSAVEMEDDSGVDLDVLTAGNCSDSSVVQYGQNLTKLTPDQSDVGSFSCKDLCDGTDNGVSDGGAATDTTILIDQEIHWLHTVQSTALPYITASDAISEKNGRTWAGTFQNVPCPTSGHRNVSADCSQNTDVSSVEHQHGEFHMSVSPINSGCKTVDSADSVVGDVPENSSTQHQGNRNGVWPSECSYLSERSFSGVISSVTVPGVTGLQDQTQPQDDTANQSPVRQPALEGHFVVNHAAVKQKTVPHATDDFKQESDSARTSALPLASLTGPSWKEASVIPRVEWVKGSAATSSNTNIFVVDLRYYEVPESSVPKHTVDTTPAATHSISIPQTPAEVPESSVPKHTVDTTPAATHSISIPQTPAENDSEYHQNKNSQQHHAAERQPVKVARVGRPRKRGRKRKASTLSPKRPKLAQTGTCAEAGVSGEKCGKVMLSADWQTADTEAPTMNTGSEHTGPGFGATTAAVEAKISSCKGKQISVIQLVSEHGVVSSSASKQSTVCTNLRSKSSAVNTSASKQPVVSPSTSKPPLMSSSTSKRPVVTASTSKQPLMSSSTSKQPVVTTSTSKQPRVSTSDQPVVSPSTSKQPRVSTSTSNQPVVSPSTSKQPRVSTSTSNQPVVSPSTSKQPVKNSSTSKQPVASISKQAIGSPSTSKQPVKNSSTSKQPVASISKQAIGSPSTSKQPVVSPSTSKQPIVSPSTSKQPVVSPSTSKQPVVSPSTSKQSVVSPSTSKQPVVSPSTSKQPVVSPSTSKQPVKNSSTSKQSVASPSTSKQPVVSPSTSKQPVVSISASKQPVVSPSTSKQPVISPSTSKQPVANTSKQSVVSPSTSKQPVVSPSTTKQPVVSSSTSKQPVVSTSASKQPVKSPTTSKQPVVSTSTFKQPVVSTSASKQPVVSPSTSKQLSVSLSTSKQPVKNSPASKQPAVSTSTSKQPAVSPSTSKQPVKSPTTSKQRLVSTSASKQPAVNISTSKQPVVSPSTSKQPVVSTSASKQPVVSTSTSKQPVVSTSASKQLIVSTSTPKQPAVSPSTSKRPMVSPSTSKQPVVSPSTSKQPVANTSKQPAVSTSTSKQPVLSPSTSKQPRVSPSTSNQPVVSPSTSKQAVVSTSSSKEPVVSTSTSEQPAVSTSTSKQTVKNSLTSKQQVVSTSTSKQPVVSTSTSKQPVKNSTSKQPEVSTSKQPVLSTSTSKQPVKNSTSKQPEVSSSTSKQLEVSTSTSKQPVKGCSKVTTCSTLLPKVTTCSTLLPKVTTCSSTLLPKVTTCSSTLLPKVTTCSSTLLPTVTTCSSTLLPKVTTCSSTLLPKVTTCSSTLLPKVTTCSSTLLPKVTICSSTLLPKVTTCSTLLPKVTTCSTLLPKVTTCSSTLLPKVTTCNSTLLPKVTTCSSTLLPKVTTCSTLLPKVTTCNTLLPKVTTCNTLLPTVTTCSSTLLPKVTTCSSTLLPKVTTCSTLLPKVTTCSTLLPTVTTCSTLLPTVTTCNTLLPKVTTCNTLLPKVTTCNTLLPKVTTCNTLLPKVTTCSTLLPKVTTCNTLLPKVTTCSTTLIPEHRTLRPCTPLQTTSVSEQATLGRENGVMVLNSVVESDAMAPSVLCIPEACFAVQQNGEEAVQNIMMCQYLPSGPWAFNAFQPPPLSFHDLCRQQTLSVNEVEVTSIFQLVRAHSSEHQRPTPTTVNRHQLSGDFQVGGNTGILPDGVVEGMKKSQCF